VDGEKGDFGHPGEISDVRHRQSADHG
jgi:hypothetical protein